MAWHYTFTYASGSTVTLPAGYVARTNDVLRVTLVHGNQQTLDFIGGVDFTHTAPSTVTVSGLPLEVGDTVHIFNLSRNYGTGTDGQGIAPLDSIYDHLGLTSPTVAQAVLVESLRVAAENAVKKFVGASLVEAQHTHFLPRSGEGSRGHLLRLPEWPLRSIESLKVDLYGYGGSAPNAFASTTAQTEGRHFYVDWNKAGFSKFGHVLKITGEWPERPGTVKVVYTAGYTQDELSGDVDDPMLDASAIRMAVMDTVLANYHATLRAREGKGLGGITSESLEGWSASYGGKEVSTAGLSESTKASLSMFRRITVI